MHSSSFGAKLEWDKAADGNYEQIGQVKDISGPSTSRSTIEVTAHDSPDGWREFVGGLKDGGEVTFAISFDAELPIHSDLLTDYDNNGCKPSKWRLSLSTCGVQAATWEFGGFLTAYAPGAPVDGSNTADLTVKVTGKPVLTVA